MRLLQKESSHVIDHQSIVVEKVGGNRSSKKASVTDLQELLPVYTVCTYWAYV